VVTSFSVNGFDFLRGMYVHSTFQRCTYSNDLGFIVVGCFDVGRLYIYAGDILEYVLFIYLFISMEYIEFRLSGKLH